MIKTTEGTQETIRLPMGNETAYEKVITPGMPTVERRYIIALGKYIARDEISAGLTSRVYYHGDHLGSTRALSGDDTGSFTYDPFGNLVESMGDAADHSHQFTGKPIQSTGLYYYGARFYDPTLGRFINMDPAKDGNNWWVYCGNNPIKYVDPDGLAELIAQSIFSFTVTDEYLDKYYQDDLPAKFMNTARQKAIVLGGAARALETVGEVALSRIGGDALSAVTDTIGVIKSVNPKRGLSINDWDPGDTVSVIGLLIAAEPSDNVNWDYAIEQYYRWDSGGGSGRSGSQSLHIDTELFTEHDGYFSSNHDLLAYNGYFPFTLHRKLDFLTRQGIFRKTPLGGTLNGAPQTSAMPY